MASESEICTLRVLHLPPTLSDERRDELFKRYGSVKTRTIRKSEKYTITFVEFPTTELAEEALLRLHQLPVKGHKLSVEYAKRNISDESEDAINSSKNTEEDEELTKCKVNFQAFLKKLNSWAPEHLFTQPPPPNIRYKYPPPTRMTLLRIAIQMVKVPALYTQVLHLMNKMNIPPPFEGLEEEFEEVREAYDMEKYKDLFDIRMESQNTNVFQEQEQREEQQEMEDSEEESEIESDEEPENPLQHIIPEKRKKRQPKTRLKIPKFINPLKQPVAPSTSKKQRPQDVFEIQRPTCQKDKIVLKSTKSTIKPAESTTRVEEKTEFIVESSGNAEGFGLIFPNKKDDKKDKEEPKQEFITTEQLHNNRISTEDQRVLPVYKNYHPGKPSNRLYIKNLAKQVEEDDLHFIYRRYVLPSSTGSESEYNVRLMQEGRMKGQAFITLPNIAQAQLALDETNGYILKDKPMVVQFAKVSKS